MLSRREETSLEPQLGLSPSRKTHPKFHNTTPKKRRRYKRESAATSPWASIYCFVSANLARPCQVGDSRERANAEVAVENGARGESWKKIQTWKICAYLLMDLARKNVRRGMPAVLQTPVLHSQAAASEQMYGMYCMRNAKCAVPQVLCATHRMRVLLQYHKQSI